MAPGCRWLQCRHHLPAAPDRDVPLLLNLTLQGQVYRSVDLWERDPDTISVVLDRLERDATAGANALLRRWDLGRVAGYFYAVRAAAGSPLCPHLRAAADRLASLAPTFPPAVQPTADSASGSLYAAAGETEAAIRAFERVARWPDPPPVAVPRLLRLYAQTGGQEKTIRLLEGLLRREPRNSSYEDTIGLMLNGHAGKPQDFHPGLNPPLPQPPRPEQAPASPDRGTSPKPQR